MTKESIVNCWRHAGFDFLLTDIDGGCPEIEEEVDDPEVVFGVRFSTEIVNAVHCEPMNVLSEHMIIEEQAMEDVPVVDFSAEIRVPENAEEMEEEEVVDRIVSFSDVLRSSRTILDALDILEAPKELVSSLESIQNFFEKEKEKKKRNRRPLTSF